MKYEMKRVGIFSVIKIAFILGGAAGFLGGLFAGMIFAAIGSMFSSMGLPPEMSEIGGLAGGMGLAMVFILPFVYGFIGAVFAAIYGAIGGGLYNLAARMFGGLEWEMAPVEGAGRPAAVPPQPPPPADHSKPVPPSMFE